MADSDILAAISQKNSSVGFIKNRCVQCVFVLSCTALASLVPFGHGTIPTLAIGLVATFLTAIVVTFRFSLLQKVFENVVRWQLLLAIGFALIAAFNFYNNFCWSFHEGIKLGVLPKRFEDFSTLVYAVAGITATAAVPAAFVYLYAFISRFVPILKEGIQKSDLVEKCFLTVGGLILSVTLVVLYNTTTVFYGEPANDLVYLADSHLLVEQNSGMNINSGQNDLRHPQFGVYAMPFAITATLLSSVLFFIPHSYLICFGSEWNTIPAIDKMKSRLKMEAMVSQKRWNTR